MLQLDGDLLSIIDIDTLIDISKRTLSHLTIYPEVFVFANADFLLHFTFIITNS